MSIHISEMQILAIRLIVKCMSKAILLVSSLTQTLFDLILSDQPESEENHTPSHHSITSQMHSEGDKVPRGVDVEKYLRSCSQCQLRVSVS